MSFPSSKPFVASNCTKNGNPTLCPASTTGPCFPPTSLYTVPPPPSSHPPPALVQNLRHCSMALACAPPLPKDALLPVVLSHRDELKCHFLREASLVIPAGSPAPPSGPPSLGSFHVISFPQCGTFVPRTHPATVGIGSIWVD